MPTAYKRPHWGWFCCLFIFSVPLFFGLFFGLNYPEIVKNEWPLTTCTINAADLDTRYCCFTDCPPICNNGGFGNPQCGTLINQVNNNYNPSACAANSSSCPPQIGTTCDGGYYCCSNCCQTCSSCTTSCSSSSHSASSGQTCSQSCSTYQCNCSCCNSTNDRPCTLRCPSCFAVTLLISYTPRRGPTQTNVSYYQDFGQDQSSATNFLNSHPSGSQQHCYYNPDDLSQVSFDVSFTPWKWAVTAIFGMIPVLFFIFFVLFFCCCRPLMASITGVKQRRGERKLNEVFASATKGKEREKPTRTSTTSMENGTGGTTLELVPTEYKPPTVKKAEIEELDAPPPYVKEGEK